MGSTALTGRWAPRLRSGGARPALPFLMCCPLRCDDIYLLTTSCRRVIRHTCSADTESKWTCVTKVENQKMLHLTVAILSSSSGYALKWDSFQCGVDWFEHWRICTGWPLSGQPEKWCGIWQRMDKSGNCWIKSYQEPMFELPAVFISTLMA